MLVSPVPENALKPISERESGRSIAVSDEHPWKHCARITVTFEGILILVSLEQL